MSDAPIQFQGLTCYYGKHKALDSLTLDVPQGEVFALLGRNGAGKSSALRCLMGFQAPTRGSVRILGRDSLEAHTHFLAHHLACREVVAAC